jgi:hypothetical protein
MPEPMMVAAKTQGPELGAQGASLFPDRITPSSHGGLPRFATSWLLSEGFFTEL